MERQLSGWNKNFPELIQNFPEWRNNFSEWSNNLPERKNADKNEVKPHHIDLKEFLLVFTKPLL